jgi:hypothetical protein
MPGFTGTLRYENGVLVEVRAAPSPFPVLPFPCPPIPIPPDNVALHVYQPGAMSGIADQDEPFGPADPA